MVYFVTRVSFRTFNRSVSVLGLQADSKGLNKLIGGYMFEELRENDFLYDL